MIGDTNSFDPVINNEELQGKINETEQGKVPGSQKIGQLHISEQLTEIGKNLTTKKGEEVQVEGKRKQPVEVKEFFKNLSSLDFDEFKEGIQEIYPRYISQLEKRTEVAYIGKGASKKAYFIKSEGGKEDLIVDVNKTDFVVSVPSFSKDVYFDNISLVKTEHDEEVVNLHLFKVLASNGQLIEQAKQTLQELENSEGNKIEKEALKLLLDFASLETPNLSDNEWDLLDQDEKKTIIGVTSRAVANLYKRIQQDYGEEFSSFFPDIKDYDYDVVLTSFMKLPENKKLQIIQKFPKVKTTVWVNLEIAIRENIIQKQMYENWKDLPEQEKLLIADYLQNFSQLQFPGLHSLLEFRYLQEDSYEKMLEISYLLRTREKIDQKIEENYLALIPAEERHKFSLKDMKDSKKIEERIKKLGKDAPQELVEYRRFLENISHISLPAVVKSGNELYQVVDMKTDTLDKYLKKYSLSKEEMMDLLSQVAKGLEALHDTGISVNDLSTRNVLVQKSEGKLKYFISDFGIASSLEKDDPKFPIGENTTGPVRWMPYERINSGNQKGAKVSSDAYSFFCLAWEIFEKEKPFKNEYRTNDDIEGAIQKDYPKIKEIANSKVDKWQKNVGLSDKTSNLLKQCADKSHQKRPSYQALAEVFQEEQTVQSLEKQPNLSNRASTDQKLQEVIKNTGGISLPSTEEESNYQTQSIEVETEPNTEFGKYIKDLEKETDFSRFSNVMKENYIRFIISYSLSTEKKPVGEGGYKKALQLHRLKEISEVKKIYKLSSGRFIDVKGKVTTKKDKSEDPNVLYADSIVLTKKEKPGDLSSENLKNLSSNSALIKRLQNKEKFKKGTIGFNSLRLLLAFQGIPSLHKEEWQSLSELHKNQLVNSTKNSISSDPSLILDKKHFLSLIPQNIKDRFKEDDFFNLFSESDEETKRQILENFPRLRMEVWQLGLSSKESQNFIEKNPDYGEKIWSEVSNQEKQEMTSFLLDYAEKIWLVGYEMKEDHLFPFNALNENMIEIAVILSMREKFEIKLQNNYQNESLFAPYEKSSFSFQDSKNIDKIDEKIKLNQAKGKDTKELEKQRQFLENLSHIALPAIIQDPKDGLLRQVLDLKSGDLSHLMEGEKLEKKESLKVIYQIASGLAGLHEIGIEHMDLAARNILVKEGMNGKEYFVSDFGLARSSDEKFPKRAVTGSSDLFSFVRLIREILEPSTLYSYVSDEDLVEEIDRWQKKGHIHQDMAVCLKRCLVDVGKLPKYENTAASFQEIANIFKKAFNEA